MAGFDVGKFQFQDLARKGFTIQSDQGLLEVGKMIKSYEGGIKAFPVGAPDEASNIVKSTASNQKTLPIGVELSGGPKKNTKPIDQKRSLE